MTSGNFVGPRLGLLGDSFIYASGAVRSQVRRHSVTLACALTTQPLSVSAQASVTECRRPCERPAPRA